MENVAPFLFFGLVALVIGYIVYRNFFYKRPVRPPVPTPTPVPTPPPNPPPPTPPVPPV